MAESNNKSDLMQFLSDGGVTQLLVKSKKGEEAVLTDLKDCAFLTGDSKTNIGIYFSAHWCPPCKRYTPVLAKLYEKLQSEGMTIIFNSRDQDEAAFKSYYDEMPWCAIPFECKEKLGKSKAIPQPNGIPSLYLFDKEGKLYQKGGRGAVTDENRTFPYANPSWETCMSICQDKEGNKVSLEDLKKKKHLALYFSAHWCGPCREFTPKLVETYNKMVERYKSEGKEQDFAFIFVSSDRSVEDFKSYYADMPWYALDKAADNFAVIKETLSEMFGVGGIPSLAVATPDGEVFVKNARGAASSDPEGLEFPWPTKPFYDLKTGNLEGINENPTAILFMESGTPADKHGEHIAAMEPHAVEQHGLKSKRNVFHLTATTSEQWSQKIRKICGNFEGDGVVLLDVQEGRFVSNDLHTSPEDFKKFVSDYLAGNLEEQHKKLVF